MLATQYILENKEQERGEERTIIDDLSLANKKDTPVQQVQGIVTKLDGHVKRIAGLSHESPRVADYLSCVLLTLLKHGTIPCEQKYLDAARAAIVPLLKLSRFEERYVLPSRDV